MCIYIINTCGKMYIQSFVYDKITSLSHRDIMGIHFEMCESTF